MDIVIRATVIFFLLFAALRMAGPRELAEMSPFELIVTIVIGDLVQQAITQNDFSVTGGALAFGTILFWTLAMSWASYLSKSAERILEGEPRVFIVDGEFLKKHARPLRLTINEIYSAMRGQGIGTIEEVALGVLEPSGKLTFIKKANAPQT